MLRVTPQCVRRWAAACKLPGYRILGDSWRFKKDEVEAWIETQRPKPPKPKEKIEWRPSISAAQSTGVVPPSQGSSTASLLKQRLGLKPKAA
ncbi:helix-turn-helix domain-containing protein [Skermanella pratensis]|uniref:helix-turn-helix domain-containing protein n=1 Tax=Skermanella pratensis TaxID=2233999 RepID=UPI0013018ADE